MEITAPNSTDSNQQPNLGRWQHLTSQKRLRRELDFLQRIIDSERAQRLQAQADYDQVEAELVGLLSVDYSITPNTTLIAMAHADLAIYADQLRAKCLVLQGGQHE